jgi:serine/threonine protein kinase
VICRYQLPYPLASLYRLAHSSHEPSVRFGFALRLAEGIFRFLALVNLADAASLRAPIKQMKVWLQTLETSGMGKLLGLFRATTEFLTGNAGPFVREVPSLLEAEWAAAAAAVVEIRNRWTHDEVQITNAEASPLLNDLTSPLRILLSKVQFLARYRLGTVQALRATGTTFSYYWYASRGMEEVCEPVALKGQEAPSDNLVMLLHPEDGRALYLTPFFYWGLTTGDRAAHHAWLHSLEKAPDGEQLGRYRHPVLRQDVVRRFPDTDDPDGGGVTLKEYLQRLETWPGRVDLRLLPESVQRLHDPLTPTSFDERYRIVGKLGEGGMGTVWEAEDTHLHRRCALKMLRGDFARSPDTLRRFQREGKLLANLEHPGVVRVFDFGLGPDQVPYLVMELAEGEDLELRLAREGPLGPHAAAAILQQVLAALEAIHKAGVVHRDIKPGNLILSGNAVRLVDFGIAAVQGGSRFTQTMDRMGTHSYMAPEQWQGQFSPRSDVYACGRLLFSLLAGRCPTGPEDKLGRAVAEVSAALEQVYETATAAEPGNRYPSARAMAEALAAALNPPEAARTAERTGPTPDVPSSPARLIKTKELERLWQITAGKDVYSWRLWGPYVSDRAWGTVREDYSPDGDAWGYLPHDLARSKAYRWGEDGIAGICDRYQLLCFAPAFWNEKDPILKERLFGLTPREGNHGEDVKEYYFHLENTPTHSYMKFLYKYPQGAYPYRQLIEENQRRNGQGSEYELLDTGIFDDDRYFDIVIEYAKISEEDIAIRIEAFNRGPDAAPLHILPHLWFRNLWAWYAQPLPEPAIRSGSKRGGYLRLAADDSDAKMPPEIPLQYELGVRTLYGPAGGTQLFTNNETNMPRVYGAGSTSRSLYVKDAFHRHIIQGEACVNPNQVGTKAALHYRFEVPAQDSVVLRLRLSDDNRLQNPLAKIEAEVAQRHTEADEFYGSIHRPKATEDERRVQRQALAGLLWTKQSYLFDVEAWLKGDRADRPPPASRKTIRNHHWTHLHSTRVMTLPDKWEYPLFSAWDLSFQCVALALVDPQYAKDQLWVLLFAQFLHPNGQIPSHEWEFSDLQPPVHAWAVWRVYNMDRIRNNDTPDLDFLERCFHKLLLNFAWWINVVDSQGNNIFGGGSLGLDNITVFDRSEKIAGSGVLQQADATGWMGMFCLNLMRIALELAEKKPDYEGLATKFFQHFAYVAHAMKHMGGRNYALWDETDGFFYDVLRFPDGSFHKLRVRSLVGLIPLFAVERLDVGWMQQFKGFTAHFHSFRANRKDLVEEVVHDVCGPDGEVTTHVFSILDKDQLTRVVNRIWDGDEFLSDYGIRSLSKAHEKHPFQFDGKVVGYEPAEAVATIKGRNANWRGPIWFPANFLLIESFRKLGNAWGKDFTLTPPAAHGQPITFAEMARGIAERLISIFTRAASGRRPVFASARKFQEDPHWRDYLLFYEYFHGDNGAGLGASHQTGWTALVASLIDEWRK